MNEGGGNKVRDLSGNVNVGTITNALWSPVKYGNGLYFDGNGDFVKVLDSPVLRITTALTLSVWLKYDNYNDTNDYIIEKGVSDYAIIYGYISKKFEFYAEGYTGDNPRTAMATTLEDNNWHHVVFTFGAGYVRGYWDGNLNVSSAKSTVLRTSTNNYFIGSSRGIGDAGSAFFKGYIDNHLLYNRVLAANEILRLYREPFAMFGRRPIELWSVPAAGGLSIPVAMRTYRNRRVA